MHEAPCFFSGGGRERKGMDRILILLMEQVTVRTQLTITRKVRIQIARTEKSRKNQTVTDSPQRLRRFTSDDSGGRYRFYHLDEDGNAAFITVMSMEMGG